MVDGAREQIARHLGVEGEERADGLEPHPEVRDDRRSAGSRPWPSDPAPAGAAAPCCAPRTSADPRAGAASPGRWPRPARPRARSGAAGARDPARRPAPPAARARPRRPGPGSASAPARRAARPAAGWRPRGRPGSARRRYWPGTRRAPRAAPPRLGSAIRSRTARMMPTAWAKRFCWSARTKISRRRPRTSGRTMSGQLAVMSSSVVTTRRSMASSLSVSGPKASGSAATSTAIASRSTVGFWASSARWSSGL